MYRIISFSMSNVKSTINILEYRVLLRVRIIINKKKNIIVIGVAAEAAATAPMNVDYYSADGIIFISHSHQFYSMRKFQFVIRCFFYQYGFFVVVFIIMNY